MPKPLLTIKDFSQGIVYDETNQTSNGFYDVVNIDLKNVEGSATLGQSFIQTLGSGNFLFSNNPISWDVDIRTGAEGGESNVFAPRAPNGGSSAQIARYNGLSKTWSTFMNTLTGYPPIYHEIATFNNSMVYSNGAGFMGSCFGWTSGSNVNINVINGSATVTISLGYGMQIFSARMIGGTFSLWNGTTYVNYTVSAFVSTTQITLSTTYAGTTTATKGYCYNFTNTGFRRTDGIVTTCALPNTTTLYRPIIEKDGQLYVGDGSTVCTLDATMTLWSTINGSGAISVGSDYMVKQIQKIGGYLYILADKMPQAFYNSQNLSQVQLQNESRLFVWDGSSQGFSNIIDIGTHCYCIKTIENRIYALLRSTKGDGALFTYFNGSDFPTIGKIQLNNISCPISNLAYDRGKFLIVVNGVNREGTTINAIYTYGSYANEGSCIYSPYSNSLGKIAGIGFVKDGGDGLDSASINGGIGQILMLSQDVASGDKVLKRSRALYQPSGYITTQMYDITGYQYSQLVKGVQLTFKSTLNSINPVQVWYKGDEELSFTLLGAITSVNQKNILYGINKRYKEIQLQIVQFANSTPTSTPILSQISFY